MFSRKLLRTKRILSFKSNYVLKCYSTESSVTNLQYEETYLGPLSEKRPERESFLKALIAGNLDADVFTYPEQSSDRYKNFVKWLKPIETYMSSISGNQKLNKSEVLNHLRELDVFRTHINEQNFGLELSRTESLRLIEVLNAVPWFGSHFVKNHVLPVQLIQKYGSDDLKLKYLPKIMNGEIVPTICISDGDCRTNINDITTYIVPEEQSWLLNGEKTFVVNGVNSNLFLVFARHGTHSYMDKPNAFSLVAVEKGFSNVTCKNIYETIGRHETPTCTMCFEDTIVPGKNIIGEPNNGFTMLLECLKPGQQNISAQAISILRNFVNQLIPDILKLKHYDRNLYEFDIVKKIIGEITFSLYTMESMAYLTGGMIDQYENMDADLEQIITDSYCANKCINCIQSGLQLLGASSYMSNQLYIQSLHDAIALTTIDTSNLDTDTYVAARILQFIGKTTYDHIYKKRNYLKYPVYNMIDSMINRSEIRINAEEHLHPSVQPAVENLETCLNEFREGVTALFVRHGSEVAEKYSDLHRITQMATELYACYANILRSSRAYSIGVRNADIERNIGLSTSFIAESKLTELKKNIDYGPFCNGDYCYTSTMDLVYEKRKYPLEHPLTRTY